MGGIVLRAILWLNDAAVEYADPTFESEDLLLAPGGGAATTGDVVAGSAGQPAAGAGSCTARRARRQQVRTSTDVFCLTYLGSVFAGSNIARLPAFKMPQPRRDGSVDKWQCHSWRACCSGGARRRLPSSAQLRLHVPASTGRQPDSRRISTSTYSPAQQVVCRTMCTNYAL